MPRELLIKSGHVVTVDPDLGDLTGISLRHSPDDVYAGHAVVWHLEDEIGTLTPGKQADIVIIDMRSPHLDGFGDPVAVMVLGAGPADVETVIAGGDVVKRDGVLAGDHVEQARKLMHATRHHLGA